MRKIRLYRGAVVKTIDYTKEAMAQIDFTKFYHSEIYWEPTPAKTTEEMNQAIMGNYKVER